MRILWLGSDFLLPLDKGGKLRSYHLLRHLAKRHSIRFISYAEPEAVHQYGAKMAEVCDALEVLPRHDAKKGSLGFYVDVAKHLADPCPYAVAKYRSKAFENTVQRALLSRPDLVVCDFLTPVANLPDTMGIPSVLFTHNVESEIWRRHLETQENPVRRALFRTQHQRMLRFEHDALKRFDLVLAVSQADADRLEELYHTHKPIRVVSTGVDTDYFRPCDVPAEKNKMVFTGSMDWIPNEDAMVYFCQRILPEIRLINPNATLDIVGRSPTPTVKKLAEQYNVNVTGRVDDVRPHIASAGVYIVPLRVGGGTRLKIFEAMAMGKAIVSTSVGCEGLPVTHGKDILIADDPLEFAHVVTSLLNDEAAQKRIGTAARDLVEQHFDWSAVSHELEGSLKEAIEIAHAREQQTAA